MLGGGFITAAAPLLIVHFGVLPAFGVALASIALANLVADLIDHLKYFSLGITAIYIGSRFLELSPAAKHVLDRILILGLIVQGAF